MSTYMYDFGTGIYFLQPLWVQHTSGRIQITGATIFSTEGTRLGHYCVENMPRKLIHQLEEHVKKGRAQKTFRRNNNQLNIKKG